MCVLTISLCASAAPTAVPTLAGGEGNYTVENSSPRQALPEPEPAFTVIILIMYRTLGGLLPARYQVDRRSIRYVLLSFVLHKHQWREAGWTLLCPLRQLLSLSAMAWVWFPARRSCGTLPVPHPGIALTHDAGSAEPFLLRRPWRMSGKSPEGCSCQSW